MSDSAPTWELVLDAASDLTRRGQTPFQLQTLVREVQRRDPSRGRESIQPIIQGMTVNAGTGPPSRAGKPLERVMHGYYQLRDNGDTSQVETPTAIVTTTTDQSEFRSREAVSRLEQALDIVATELSTLIDSGLEHVLTEDILRFSLIRALVDLNEEPSNIRTEVRVHGIGALDLVVGPCAVELKFPRDPTNFGAADTMTLGELIKDFYKVAHSGFGQAFVVQMTDDRLRRYLGRRVAPEPTWDFDVDGSITFRKEGVMALPKTAATPGLIALSEAGAVVATCVSAHRIHDWLMVAWSVQLADSP